MEITFYGVNIRDKNIKLPFLNAIEKVGISDNYLNAITLLDIINKDISNEMTNLDLLDKELTDLQEGPGEGKK